MSRNTAIITHTEFMGGVYEVNAGEFKNMKLDGTILKKVLSQVEVMLTHHNKVLVIRFDLHQNHYTKDNAHLNNYFKNVVRKAKRKYKLLRVGYGWAREIEKSKGQHYHCFIILDGNKVKNAYPLMEYMRKDWIFRTDSSFHIVRPYHHFTRTDYKKIQNAIHHLSYLAKARGKGYKGKNARDYSTSCLK